jgi:HD superfamily phosphohydrolase
MVSNIEIRDPIHGFIQLNEWEKDIIDHSVFQRLRRIKQLSWTDMVYPAANHTRFEHSLGVMHVATKMYESIINNANDILKNELYYDESGLNRDRILVRIAALLHDVGHSPFSHVGEGLMPEKPNSDDTYEHEDYSGALIVNKMKNVIENHPFNENYHIEVEEIKNFLEGNSESGRSLIWRDLISSQLDADRADYLLRDSHHIGVKYGEFDLDRLIHTLTIGYSPETDQPSIAIDIGGKQVAESLIIARYLMFVQVYFHHTRRAYDLAVTDYLKSILENGVFPLPNESGVDEYFTWDDWKVKGMIHGEDNKLSDILKQRKHYRSIYNTRDNPEIEEIEKTELLMEKLKENKIDAVIDEAQKSWYKFKNDELLISLNDNRCVPLSNISNVVKGLKAVNKQRVYVSLADKSRAEEIKNNFLGKEVG